MTIRRRSQAGVGKRAANKSSGINRSAGESSSSARGKKRSAKLLGKFHRKARKIVRRARRALVSKFGPKNQKASDDAVAQRQPRNVPKISDPAAVSKTVSNNSRSEGSSNAARQTGHAQSVAKQLPCAVSENDETSRPGLSTQGESSQTSSSNPVPLPPKPEPPAAVHISVDPCSETLPAVAECAEDPEAIQEAINQCESGSETLPELAGEDACAIVPLPGGPEIRSAMEGLSGGSAVPDQPVTTKLLLIDDDPSLNNLLKIGLAPFGYECVAAENGKAAQQVLQTFRPDLILVDLFMPVMDGLAFIQWLRETAHDGTPVLVFTSLDDVSVAEEALKSGANSLIGKPVRMKGLVEAMKRLVPV